MKYNRIGYFDFQKNRWIEIYRNNTGKLMKGKSFRNRNQLVQYFQKKKLTPSPHTETSQGEKNNIYKIVTKKNSIVYNDTYDILRNQRFIDKQLKRWNSLSKKEKTELGKKIREYTYNYKKDIFLKKYKRDKPEKSELDISPEMYDDIYDEYPLIPMDVIMINTLKTDSAEPKVYISPNDYDALIDAYNIIPNNPTRIEIEIIMPQKTIKIKVTKKQFFDKKKLISKLEKKLYDARQAGDINELSYNTFRNGIVKIKLRDIL